MHMCLDVCMNVNVLYIYFYICTIPIVDGSLVITVTVSEGSFNDNKVEHIASSYMYLRTSI
jgi:hypothetical protein